MICQGAPTHETGIPSSSWILTASFFQRQPMIKKPWHVTMCQKHRTGQAISDISMESMTWSLQVYCSLPHLSHLSWFFSNSQDNGIFHGFLDPTKLQQIWEANLNRPTTVTDQVCGPFLGLIFHTTGSSARTSWRWWADLWRNCTCDFWSTAADNRNTWQVVKTATVVLRDVFSPSLQGLVFTSI